MNRTHDSIFVPIDGRDDVQTRAYRLPRRIETETKANGGYASLRETFGVLQLRGTWGAFLTRVIEPGEISPRLFIQPNEKIQRGRLRTNTADNSFKISAVIQFSWLVTHHN